MSESKKDLSSPVTSPSGVDDGNPESCDGVKAELMTTSLDLSIICLLQALGSLSLTHLQGSLMQEISEAYKDKELHQ